MKNKQVLGQQGLDQSKAWGWRSEPIKSMQLTVCTNHQHEADGLHQSLAWAYCTLLSSLIQCSGVTVMASAEQAGFAVWLLRDWLKRGCWARRYSCLATAWPALSAPYVTPMEVCRCDCFHSFHWRRIFGLVLYSYPGSAPVGFQSAWYSIFQNKNVTLKHRPNVMPRSAPIWTDDISQLSVSSLCFLVQSFLESLLSWM